MWIWYYNNQNLLEVIGNAEAQAPPQTYWVGIYIFPV